MSVKIIGMIGVTPPTTDATVHIITGGISPDYLKSFSQAHEAADYDLVLVGYTSQSAEGIAVASYAAAHTETLSYLIAHRPGFVAPTLMARKFATFDQLWQGRLAIHIIAGLSDKEQMMDGDNLIKEDRYRRAGEYLDVMHKAWAGGGPFEYEGEFYSVRGARTDILPLQQPYPTVYFGGSSEGALAMGAQHCDVFAMFAEPLAETAARIADFLSRADKWGRTPRFNMSVRPIIAETEGAAWDKAAHILAQVEAEVAVTGQHIPKDESGSRIMALAAKADIHDERLWMPLAAAYGARGNTTCLVGTAEQVAEACLEYYKLGVGGFLLRGFDPLNDVEDYGRELIPRIRAGAAALG
ncbi:MAG: LLM class flavin-dependent oxidoreductase [Alphaproteobacteria bacterium]|jgi:alkanesulfonate monooxygenase|nr:LLM class flavin-dependent oxidoreductase [Alphaproteobacteria bacterium]